MFRLTSILPPLSLSGSSTYNSFTLKETSTEALLRWGHPSRRQGTARDTSLGDHCSDNPDSHLGEAWTCSGTGVGGGQGSHLRGTLQMWALPLRRRGGGLDGMAARARSQTDSLSNSKVNPDSLFYGTQADTFTSVNPSVKRGYHHPLLMGCFEHSHEN